MRFQISPAHSIPFLYMLYGYFQLHSLFYSPSVWSMASTLFTIPFFIKNNRVSWDQFRVEWLSFRYTTNLLSLTWFCISTPNDAGVIIQWFIKFEIISYCSHLHRKSAPFQVEYKLPLSPWLQGGIRFFPHALPSWPFYSITRFVPTTSEPIGFTKFRLTDFQWLF